MDFRLFKRENISLLESEYIIDGVKMEATPYMILDAVSMTSKERGKQEAGLPEPIMDESIDLPAPLQETSSSQVEDAAKKVYALSRKDRVLPLAYSAPYSVAKVAGSVIDTLWHKGHFRIEDLAIDTIWTWNDNEVGNAAAFYRSVESSANYLSGLGISIAKYGVKQGKKCSFETQCVLRQCHDTDEEVAPFGSRNPSMEKGRACPSTFKGDKSSWIIYVPFDSCKYRLGGSLFSEATGAGGGRFPEISDADYFMDCYEVVREFVEDGILLSGVSVGEGGMMTALCKMAENGRGADLDIGGLLDSYGENDRCCVLYGEIPGVIIEINDSDYDYVDAEFLLQDVAYFPLGHPDGKSLKIHSNETGGIAGILQALLNGQTTEGED